MASLIKLIYVMSIVFELHASYLSSICCISKSKLMCRSDSNSDVSKLSEMIKKEQRELIRNAGESLEDDIAQTKAKVNVMPVSFELEYWLKIIEEYESALAPALKIQNLIKLFREKCPKNCPIMQSTTIMFIVSVMDKEDIADCKRTITPISMVSIKQSSFFKQITTGENAASN